MIRITVESLPRGDTHAARTLGVITIENRGVGREHGPNDLCIYSVDLAQHRDLHPSRLGTVEHCRSHGWWALCARVFAMRGRRRNGW